MKIIVPGKRVVDDNVKVRVESEGTGVDLTNVKMSMNPFDEIAVEEAVRLKEKGVATEVIAVFCGVTQFLADGWANVPLEISWQRRPVKNAHSLALSDANGMISDSMKMITQQHI